MKEERVKQALIMAAGYGTRLEPLTLAVPKPMVPIVNKPTMQHNMELLRRNGIRDITANIHYHPEQITNYFRDGSDFGVDLVYSFEETLLGTAGGVKRMARIADVRDTFVVLSSDALTDINLRRMIAVHNKKKALVTMALSPVPDPSEFGVVALDERDRITAFQEKPKKGKALSNLVNSGIYVFEPEVLDLIPEGRFSDFGSEIFPRLAKKKEGIFGYRMVEYWSDVGGLAPYIKANYDAMQGTVRIFIPGKKVSSYVWTGRHCEIDESVQFEGCVIVGDRCEIRRGSYLKDVVLGDRCVVGQEVKIEGSIIWSDSYLSRHGSVLKSVIGNWCHVGEGVKISAHSIVSNRCQVRRGIHLAEDSRLKPNEIL